MRKLGRREFMLRAGGAALAGAATPAKVFAQATPPQGAAPQPQQLVTRRPVGSMQPNDPAMASYYLAVERMRALPDTDPRSWNAITQIHVTSCPHSNWFFLPWHRAYLVAFERICRQVSGDPNFALPYWDWTEQRQIPPAFTAATVAGRANALLDATREAAATDSLREADVGPATIARIMAETDFENFGSSRPTGQTTTEARWLRETGRATELEATPHGGVHVFVGGDMGQMISPRDPIFFLHHCNVDRLWARWIAQGRRNSADPLWATFQFNGTFQVPEGQGMTAFNVGVTDMLDHRRWGYTYPDLPAGDGGQVVASAEAAVSRPQRVLASQAAVGTATLNRALSTTLTLPAAQPLVETGASGRAGAAAGNAFDPNSILRETPLGPAAPTAKPPVAGAAGGPGADNVAASIPNGRIFSVLESVKSSNSSAVAANVFLNHPNPTSSTPENDPHFVGTFSLFGLESHAAHGGFNVQVELTQTIGRLQRMNRLTGSQLAVQVIPVKARSTNLEANRKGDNVEMSLGRINITTM